MKYLGQLRYFLELEIFDAPDGIYLSQTKYASDLISRSGMTDSQSASTPLKGNCRLTHFDDTPLEDPSRYQQLVESLIYLTVTHPDIAHVVHIVSQFMANQRTMHYVVVLRILRYVKGTILHGLHFSADSPLVLVGFFDADWADIVHLSHVSSENHTADIFTKSLFPSRFSTLLSNLKLVSTLPS
ncbi:uncharacterized mitochondrial protein AtMg00810-like [Andrographis paniculata]|uniref:uncharacterized mitochondrial protein AtMg00810-like n=1 Tax=Andrographis paniculata TaxID=175694 RepID=UPI0021E8ACEE|nr:uncharacterized mitochondrial protein AtMg00810-like [Andrographis paniculata]